MSVRAKDKRVATPPRKTSKQPSRKPVPAMRRTEKRSARTVVKKNTRAASKVQGATGSASNAAWEKIYTAIERIPRGCVATYGGIASVAGLPGRARLVGTALRNVASSRKLPWYRVLTASGRFAFPPGSDAYRKQQQNLQREGVFLAKGRVDLRTRGWPNEVRELDEVLWRMS